MVKMMLQENELKEIGIHEYGMILTTDIPFEQEIRRICEDNSCRLYGKPGHVLRQWELWMNAVRDAFSIKQHWYSMRYIPWRIPLIMKGCSGDMKRLKICVTVFIHWQKRSFVSFCYYPMKDANDAKAVHILLLHADNQNYCFHPWKVLGFM